jgi:hypothetical protein
MSVTVIPAWLGVLGHLDQALAGVDEAIAHHQKEIAYFLEQRAAIVAVRGPGAAPFPTVGNGELEQELERRVRNHQTTALMDRAAREALSRASGAPPPEEQGGHAQGFSVDPAEDPLLRELEEVPGPPRATLDQGAIDALIKGTLAYGVGDETLEAGESQELIDRARASGLDPRPRYGRRHTHQPELLAFVSGRPGSGAKAIADGITHMNPNTLRKLLGELVSSGELRKTGTHRGTRYYPATGPMVRPERIERPDVVAPTFAPDVPDPEQDEVWLKLEGEARRRAKSLGHELGKFRPQDKDRVAKCSRCGTYVTIDRAAKVSGPGVRSECIR